MTPFNDMNSYINKKLEEYWVKILKYLTGNNYQKIIISDTEPTDTTVLWFDTSE